MSDAVHRGNRAVLIAGPTASGKSALAMDLAERLDGVVVNADSMQVYRDLRVITARPSEADERRVPHQLYGDVDAGVNYSTGQWLRDVAAVLDEARAQRKVPILVGGTGLYFKALTSGLAAVPPVPADIRAAVRARVREQGAAAMHAELARRDPATAQRLMVNDRSRISRALEVMEATGRSITDWHSEGMAPLIDAAHAAKVFLATERQALVARISARFGDMLEAGALDEVRVLMARKLDPLLPAMKAHGVPWLARHLSGEVDLEAATEGARMDTRRYAKRQGTWFRNQMPDWPWETPEKAGAALEKQFSGLK